MKLLSTQNLPEAIQGGKFFLFLSAFLAPIKAAMIAVGALIAIDFIFGVIAAKKTGDKISSKKMSKTIIKMFVYQMLIITAHICELYLVDYIPFVQIVLGFLALTEFYSIGENFTKITGMNFIAYAKNIIMGKLKDKMAKDIEPVKEEDSKEEATMIGSSGDFNESNHSEK